MCATCPTCTMSDQHIQHVINLLAKFSTYHLSIDMYKDKATFIKLLIKFPSIYYQIYLLLYISIYLYYLKNDWNSIHLLPPAPPPLSLFIPFLLPSFVILSKDPTS